MWKFDLSDKIKWEYFKAVAMSVLLYGCTTWTLTKHQEKKPGGNYTGCSEQILEVAPNKIAAVWPLTFHLTNHPSKTNKIYWTSQNKLLSNYGLQHMDTPVGVSQQRVTFIRTV